MSSTILLTKIYIYKGPKSSTFYNFFYTVFYILQHDFDLNLHLHQPQNSTFYKFFLHIFYFLQVYFGSILHSTYNRAPPLAHLSKVVNWWYTEKLILVRNLSHVISALKHLSKMVICWYTKEPTLVRNLSPCDKCP